MGRRADIGVVIPAGGSGTRVGGGIPKQFLSLRGAPILVRTIALFQRMGEIGPIVVVVPAPHLLRATRMLRRARLTKVVAIVPGGNDRQASVLAGLKAFPLQPRYVLVHDAVRPFVSLQTVAKVIREVRRHGAAIAAKRVTDTIKMEHPRGAIARTVPREGLWAAQTPQGFRFDILMLAHRAARKLRFRGTDESSLLERIGIPVRLVESEGGNIKITTPGDLKIAEFQLKRRGG